MSSCVAVTDMRVTWFSLSLAIHPFTVRDARLRMSIPEARMFLIGTAGAIDVHFPETQTWRSSLCYCHLRMAREVCERSLCLIDHF
jgi:hypothetical protein